jgi:hypothetical protein
MSAARRGPQQANLFELDLDEDAAPTIAPDDAPSLELPLATPAPRRTASPAAAIGAPPPFRTRAFAGLADFASHLAVATLAVVGVRMLGISPRMDQLPGFVLLVLVFSLFYTVVPLAFWGRTPGMAAVGLVCRVGDDQPLTFGEALRRWTGNLLTALAAGLPGLLALGGRRSLADRLSGSDVTLD